MANDNPMSVAPGQSLDTARRMVQAVLDDVQQRVVANVPISTREMQTTTSLVIALAQADAAHAAALSAAMPRILGDGYVVAARMHVQRLLGVTP